MIIIMKSTKPVLLASIKNVGKTLTPQNTKFPDLSVLGYRCYRRHTGNRDDSTLFHHRAGNDDKVNAKSTNVGTRQVRLSSASCYPTRLVP